MSSGEEGESFEGEFVSVDVLLMLDFDMETSSGRIAGRGRIIASSKVAAMLVVSRLRNGRAVWGRILLVDEECAFGGFRDVEEVFLFFSTRPAILKLESVLS